MGMGKNWARGNVLGSVTKITLANTAKQISEKFVVQSIMQTTVVFDFSNDPLCLVRKLRNEPKIGHKDEISDLL